MDKLYAGVSSVQHGSPRSLDRLRRLVVPERSDRADAQLAVALCFVAGMTNAGGFLAVGQYTSHMSGVVSGLADNLVLGALGLVAAGAGALAAFLAGAACSAILINWGRRRGNASQYALPLSLEAALLLVFGVLGALRLHIPYFLGVAVPLLCFIMGLQNAIITKISRARIRTTHMTG
ncbi:YoaK family protein, partial [Azospirillum sp. B4]|uniref:YoaK family protein n=1 Tax=Azospirillum sp. B4 TaxID=95605 RepID=UPI0005C8966C